jgi:anion transporter
MGGSYLNSLADVPLLAALPKVEQAKLLGDMEELELGAGDILPDAAASKDWVYFVVRGEVEVTCYETDRELPLLVFGPGEILAGGSTPTGQSAGRRFRTITPARLCRVPAVKVERLLRTDTNLVQGLIKQLADRTNHTLHELARTKAILAAYTDAVWDEVPGPEAREAAAAFPATTPQRIPTPTAGESPSPRIAHPRAQAETASWPLIPVISAIVLTLLAYWFPLGTPKLTATSAILLWATCNWLFNRIPDYVVGLAAGAMLVLTGVVTPAVAFSGFANPSWFLLLGAGGLGVAVSRSGLLYRAALHMLRLLPASYKGQSLAMAFTGLLFTPLLPSANSRVAMASPLSQELSEAMRFPDLGKGSAGMAMSTFLGFGLMYFMFLNGSNTSLLAWSLLPDVVQKQVTWGFWLLASLPLAILVFAGCYAAIQYLYRPEPTTGVSRRTISAQLQVLGPMTRLEKITAAVLGSVLLGFITQGMHGIDPGWVALGGFLALIAMGAVDKNGLKAIDWNFLLLFGTLVSLSGITKVSGLSDLLTGWIQPALQPLSASPYLFLGAIAVLTLVVRLVIPLQPTVLIMVVALLPVSVKMGYNPFTVALIVLTMSNNWFVPQQNSVYLGVYSATEERAFTHAQTRPLAIVHAFVGVVGILVSVPFWQLLGVVPK